MIVNNSFSLPLWVLAIIAVIAGLPTSAIRAQPPPHGMDALRQLDARVAAVGHRLAVSAGALCPNQTWLPGFALHDLAQYAPADRPRLAEALGLARGPGVLALAPGGPAERAGLRPDDILVALDGAALPRPELPARASFATLERLLDEVDRAFADGAAAIRAERGASVVELRVEAERGCASRFQLVPAGRLNAYADGRYVQITSALAAFADTDEALAAVLAHELAHNILGHRVALDAAGVQRGLLGNFGRNARLIRQTEMAADRLSIHLLARAGYELGGVPDFWRRFARQGLNFLGSTTHGNWQGRIARMEAEIAAVRAARADGRQADPPAARDGE